MTVLLLDAHSHLRPEFSLGAYLEGARASLARHASSENFSTWQGCLCVAQTSSSEVANRLERVCASDRKRASAEWKLIRTDESVSWIAQHEDGWRMVLILGRQLRTDDGFEVLQIGSLDRSDESRRDLRTQVSRVTERGAYPVVPWGFGKWTFRRRRILLDCLSTWEPDEVALADSALRPRVLPDHPVLSAARERGFGVLAGTDLLPLATHERRTGRYVAALDAQLSTNKPWSELRSVLPGAQPAVLGQRDGLARSLWDQARLRIG